MHLRLERDGYSIIIKDIGSRTESGDE
jgi:hypothetical protein